MLRAITNTLATLIAGSIFAVSVVTVGFYLSPEAVRAAEPDPFQTQFRAQTIDGMKITYRKAGDPANPTVLLLHGFPPSSRMFRNLIPVIAQDDHVIAPDYPGFSASDMPPADTYD